MELRKNWTLARFPSLHHRKEGCLRHQENFAKPPKLTQTGWFSFCSHRKTTPSSRSADASRYFLDRSATPPCGDARRGVAPPVALPQFFTAPQTRLQFRIYEFRYRNQLAVHEWSYGFAKR